MGSPRRRPEPLDLQQVVTASPNAAQLPDSDQITPDPAYWPPGTPPRPSSSYFVSTYSDVMSKPQQAPTSTTALSELWTPEPTVDASMASQNQSEFVFPSLPIDPHLDAFDTFCAIPQQDLPPTQEVTDVWPQCINEETLLPWIDVYFKRLHPTIPILNPTTMYREMLLRKHHSDTQYGAMLLGLCAFAMTQPLQIHERASVPSQSIKARMILEKCVRMRVTADFGEDPSIEMILTSFFLFACLFDSNRHKAAWHRLREAVDLAYSLGLHLPESYDVLEAERREQCLRTYLVLSVTERAYALQQRHSIDFRGRPGINARFMQAFDPTAATEYISRLIYQDQPNSVGMTGLLYLVETFDAIDESVIDCWNGHCRYSDGACDSFDRRRALQMFRAQRRAREACHTGNISFAPSVVPLPLAQLVESQQADISITQFWLLNRLWNLCLSHGLLRESSDHAELRYDFACQIAKSIMATCDKLCLSAMEVHGVGLVKKIYDIAMDIITAMSFLPRLELDITLTPLEADVIPMCGQTGDEPTVRQLLQGLSSLIRRFRGGDHQYTSQFAASLSAIPGYHRSSE